DGDVILWRRPNKPRGMTGEQYRRYPKELTMRQVTVDARDRENRAGVFQVVTTILDASIDGGQIGALYEQRWSGEIDIRSIKSTLQMDVLRCKTPEMVHKEVWAHLLAYNLLRTVMAGAAAEAGCPVEPGTSRGQTAGESLEMVLKLATFVWRTDARKSLCLEKTQTPKRPGLLQYLLDKRCVGRSNRWRLPPGMIGDALP